MAEASSRTSSRLTPSLAWRVVTDAPLMGTALAREAGLLLAWDQAHTVCLYDDTGRRVREVRAPAPIITARISDDGARVALLLGGPRLIVLDQEFETLADRPALTGAHTLDIDSHGRFVVVATRQSECQFYTFHGKPVGKFTTKQPLTHVRFVPSLPLVVGAAGYGVLAGILIDVGAGPPLRAEVAWEERLMSNLGRLEVTGDGTMILASCFNLGIQRYDNDGHNEGSYHVGGTAIHAVPDFPGRLIAVATQEGEVALLNRSGNVRWKDAIGRAPVALEIDALGRYLIYGLETGEICKLDLEGQPKRSDRETSGAAKAGAGTLRRPLWSVELARSEDEGQAAVLAVLDDPPRVAAILRNNRLQVFDTGGELLHAPPEIVGVGRILRTAPGWIAAATDRQLLLHNARTGDSKRVEIDLHELTHLVIRPDGYGLAVVQEGDLAGRATPAGRWVWKKEMRMQIEEIAIGPMGLTALACNDGSLLVLDAAGEVAGRFMPDPPEPLLLIECAAEANPTRAAWITLARRAQVLRAHSPDGSAIWESPTPFEGWRLSSVAGMACVTSPDGRVLVYDQSGYLVAQAGAEAAPFVLAPGPKTTAVRLIQRDVHLICAALDGTVLWRTIGESPPGPTFGGRSGIATMMGRHLAWFANLR